MSRASSTRGSTRSTAATTPGETDDELDPSFADAARGDEDFAQLRDDPRFASITDAR
jgi:hypothetical protein